MSTKKYDWEGPPPDNKFELENCRSEGPKAIQFNGKSRLVLGRSSTDADVTIASATASRKHALLVYNKQDFHVYLYDMGSAHGTFVDNKRIRDNGKSLRVDEEISLGHEGDAARYRVRALPSTKRVSEGDGEDRAAKKAKQVCASHILVKHKGSRKPSSKRDPEGKHIQNRTKEDARSILEGYLKDLEKGEVSFEELAYRASDCNSFQKDGDLGFFEYEKMQVAFTEAAFGLKIDEISGVVESDAGLHIIKRTG